MTPSSSIQLQLSAAQVDRLVWLAREAPKRRHRECLHLSHRSRVQMMLICLLKDAVIAPHRQNVSEKTYFLLKGRFDLIFFDENGLQTEEILLEEGGSTVAINFNPAIYHTVKCKSDYCLYLETIQGPFREERTEWLPLLPS